jgi:Zn-dependent protease with chaperone function/tetratricopeptide (TPR) repeat protein
MRSYLLLPFIAILGLPTAHAAPPPWTQTDTETEEQADTLLDQNDFAGAEKLYREVLDRHPNESVALIYHVKALDGLGRHDEALQESEAALADGKNTFLALEWKGISLLQLGRYREAFDVLNQSMQLQPSEKSTRLWLSEAQRKLGDTRQADATLESIVQAEEPARRAREMANNADALHRMHEDAFAVAWWQRAYAAGNHDSARYLAWAFSNGIGVPEDYAEQEMWTRRGNDPYPWFPQLPEATAWIDKTHGWILVLALLLSAVLFPLLTVGAGAFLAGWNVTTDLAIHWSERARRSYPLQVFLGVSLMLMPTVYAASTLDYPRSQLPIPRALFAILVFVVALVSTNAACTWWSRRFRPHPDTARQNLQGFFVLILLFLTTLVISAFTAANLPTEWGFRSALVIVAGLLAYFWMQFGGLVRVTRWLRAATPADPALLKETTRLAHERGLPMPNVFLLHWSRANAVTFTFSNTIMFTRRSREILTPEETRTVLAHELAHLCESRSAQAWRLLVPLALFTLFVMPAPWQVPNWLFLLPVYVIILFTFILYGKRRRQLEKRADAFAREAESTPGTYPQALARLYEDSLLPAVTSGKGQSHPHLYDRLLDAGVTPNFPRPKPPSRWGAVPAFAILFLNLGLLSALWLLFY